MRRLEKMRVRVVDGVIIYIVVSANHPPVIVIREIIGIVVIACVDVKVFGREGRRHKAVVERVFAWNIVELF